MPILIKINVPVINCYTFRGDNVYESKFGNEMLYSLPCRLFIESVIVLITIIA